MLIVCLCIFLFSCNEDKFVVQKPLKIKSISTFRYETKKNVTNDSGEKISYLEFDSLGYPILSIDFKDSTKALFFYDNSNKLNRMVKYLSDSPAEEFILKTDSNGKICEKIEKISQDREEYYYNDKGHLVSVEYFYNDKFFFKKDYMNKYDSGGNLVEISSNEVALMSFKYDNKKRIIEKSYKDLDIRIILNYDDDGYVSGWEVPVNQYDSSSKNHSDYEKAYILYEKNVNVIKNLKYSSKPGSIDVINPLSHLEDRVETKHYKGNSLKYVEKFKFEYFK